MSKAYNGLIQRYVEWNIAGTGQDHGRYNEWSYKECRFFNQSYPMARIVTAADGSKVRLVRSGTGNSWHGGNLNFASKKFCTYYVPDIGVFSPYEGDWLKEEDMHRRQGYIMLQQVRSYAELVLDATNGKKLQERNAASRVVESMSKLYDRFDKYSELFKLGWDKLPGMYATELAERMDQMVKAYNDPKRAVQRERAAARKLAKKTLGLE